eukprot:6186303-Pleurochrysis_carterae.AAC.1
MDSYGLGSTQQTDCNDYAHNLCHAKDGCFSSQLSVPPPTSQGQLVIWRGSTGIVIWIADIWNWFHANQGLPRDERTEIIVAYTTSTYVLS